MKIGIFGGSFNPIHNGHLNLCYQCNKIFNFDEILLIPTNIPPHKSNAQFISNSHRINMINLAIENQALIKSSEIEFQLGGTSYTYNTIIALKKIYPIDTEFYFLIGSDMLEIFDKW
ncbi:MAG: nicotinate-nucleotide adenylyltransferase, partial [Oscillospiraceae bacterium]